ncbi:alpha/beta hydrolase [Brevibacillus humidisoli]|uniref:esterase/lipase family protein n=1 Tax=Brevibacillus humidisoli TaxID=2895522 RepID=UPI001E4D08E4|nr:alpha/beta hydrolase [Brevibacillus humidisoli]UFJ40575.1 alpha/beta hydrolase [Brevibacillus humidisoli]
MLRKSAVLLFTFLFTLVLVSSTVFAGSVRIIIGTPGVPGTWYAGETPANLDPTKPVLLFVQGLNSAASTWWDNNDMYETAYESGYQTAFVELNDSAGTPKNMWNNGLLLAELIQKVSDYFQKEIVIVAHSKGGIDTQAALIHYGAHPYVSRVITLGSPHHGSQVANLAYSSWAGWLADLIGQQNEATYSLQTGYMNYFREVTDSHENRSKNSYYTLAGDNWYSSIFDPLFMGGLYLSAYGDNDGLVTVESAHLPYGNMLRIGSWNHSEIKEGGETFALFEPHVTGIGVMSDQQTAVRKSKLHKAVTSDLFVRGGEFSGEVEEVFLVENDVNEVTIDWLSAHPVEQIELITPEGKRSQADVESFQDDMMFKGAWHHVVKIKNPGQGEWGIRVTAPNSEDNAYLMTVHYDSDLSEKINISKKGNKWSVQSDDSVVRDDQVVAEYRVEFRPEKQRGSFGKRISKRFSGEEGISFAQGEAGIYNVTVDIQGVTAEGVPFARTILENVYVDEKGNRY